MAVLALSLPLARPSPIYLPRRDFVVTADEEAVLQLTLLATDASDAAAVSLAPTGTAGSLVLWGTMGGWDYGRLCPPNRSALYTATGVVSDAAAGRMDFTVPADTGATWPAWLGWTIHLNIGTANPRSIGWGSLQMLQAAMA
jgi:hypothetical protein